MTYNTLVLQLENYLNRYDAILIAQIPNFIYQAEQRICRESKNIGLERYVTNAFTAGDSVIPKPGRWRRTITFNYGSGFNFNTRNQLYLRTYEYVRSYWPNSTIFNVANPPMYYCDYSYTHLLIAPTPALAYPFEMAFLELPPPLTIANQTNWLTNYAPDLLLYACLLEAIPFLKNDERIPVWEKLYDRALASLENQDQLRYMDRTSDRSSD